MYSRDELFLRSLEFYFGVYFLWCLFPSLLRNSGNKHQFVTRLHTLFSMSSYQYKKSHCGDKTILRPSYLHNGISYTGKMTSSYWPRGLSQKFHIFFDILFANREQQAEHASGLPLYMSPVTAWFRLWLVIGSVTHFVRGCILGTNAS